MALVVPEPWDPEATYDVDDLVSYGGYMYRAMTTIAAGDNPRTATFTCTFSPNASYQKYDPIDPIGNETLTMRKWTIVDYEFSVHMAKLRGLNPEALIPAFDFNFKHSYLQMRGEFTTICVRNMYGGYNNGDDEEIDFMIPPALASYAGYGMPAALNSEYDDVANFGFFGEWVFAPSAGLYEDGAPKAYRYGLLQTNPLYGACFSPNTVLSMDGYAAYSSETAGAMFASMATFNRDYTYALIDDYGPPVTYVEGGTFTTPGFQDNWTAAGNDWDPASAGTSGTDPDMDTD